MLFPISENDDNASRSAVSRRIAVEPKDPNRIQGTNVNDGFDFSKEIVKDCPIPDKPGFRFHPSDEEIVGYYLKMKVKKEALPTNVILHTVNIYKHHPDTLAANHKANHKAKEWYFFTSRDKKYQNGDRPNRVAVGGHWKATGAKKLIKYRGTVLGSKMSLAFYSGKPSKRDKSCWLMDEFKLENAPGSGSDSNKMKLDDWVLCRIHKKQPKSDDTDQNQQPININGLGLPPNSNEREATDVNTNLLGYDGSMEGFNQHNVNPSYVNPTNGFAEAPQGCILPQGSFHYDINSQFFCDKDQNQQTRNTVQSGQWSTERAQFRDSTTEPGEFLCLSMGEWQLN